MLPASTISRLRTEVCCIRIQFDYSVVYDSGTRSRSREYVSGDVNHLEASFSRPYIWNPAFSDCMSSQGGYFAFLLVIPGRALTLNSLAFQCVRGVILDMQNS